MPPAVEVIEYRDSEAGSPFREWFESLDPVTAEGVSELRIHFGPGYRVYVAFDGRKLVILLGGGSKRTQNRDIAAAKSAWADYRARKVKR